MLEGGGDELFARVEFVGEGAAGDQGQLRASAGHGDGGAQGDAAAGLGAEGDQAGADLVAAAVVGRERDGALSQRLFAAARELDAAGDEEHQFVVADRAGDGAVREVHLVGDRDERGVHGALGNEFDEVPAVVDLLVDVVVGEFGVEYREQDRGEADEGADHQARPGSGGAGGVVQLGQVAEDVFGPAGELGAGRGRTGAAGVADEELGLAGAFEAGQALRSGRLGDAEFAGRSTD